MCKLYFTNGEFIDSLCEADITPVYKKDDPTDKVNYDQLVYYYYLKSLKEWL